MLNGLFKQEDLEIGKFEEFLRYERQLSERSIKLYLYAIKDLSRVVNKPLLYSTQDDVSFYLAYLKQKFENQNTIAYFVSALRIFYAWAVYNHKRNNLKKIYSFLSNVVRVKLQRRIPFVPKREEINQLRCTLKIYKELLSYDKNAFFYKKTLLAYTIFELLITTGMRSNELRNIRKKDIDLDDKVVFIKCGKGNFQRLSIFGDSALNLLRELLESNNYAPDDLIFPIKQGNVLSYMIKRWAKRAKINTQIHIHSFRHYFITESQRQGVPIQIVADQVGHRNLNTTRLYTHLTTSHIKEKYESIKI